MNMQANVQSTTPLTTAEIDSILNAEDAPTQQQLNMLFEVAFEDSQRLFELDKLQSVLPKTISAENVALQETFGSEQMIGIIPYGVEIEKVRVIAGDGTSTEFRDVNLLIEWYGGSVEQWQKKGGIVQTDNYNYDLHWAELNGVQHAVKLKSQKLTKK